MRKASMIEWSGALIIFSLALNHYTFLNESLATLLTHCLFIFFGAIFTIRLGFILKRHGTVSHLFFFRSFLLGVGLLLPVLVGTLLAGWWLSLPQEYMRFGKQMANALGLLHFPSLGWVNGKPDPAALLNPIHHLWFFEPVIHFALVGSILLQKALQHRIRSSIVFLSALTLIGVVFGALSAMGLLEVYFLPVLRMVELIGGGVMGFMVLHSVSPEQAPHPGRDKFLLGSVSLYLWHWPFLSFAMALGSGSVSVAQRAVLFLLSMVLAWITVQIFTRLTRNIREIEQRHFAFALLPFLLGFIGLWIQSSRGVPTRFPSVVRDLADYKYDFGTEYRVGKCFLDKNQKPTEFSEICVDSADSRQLPLLVVWGDSYGAHLYPGLRSIQDNRFRVGQFTTSGCPPLIDQDSGLKPDCREFNDSILERIRTLRPQSVLLSAYWMHWKDKLVSLPRTLSALKSAGVQNVMIMGSVPQWSIALPRAVYNVVREDSLHHRIPKRLNDSSMKELYEFERRFRASLVSSQITYLPALEVFCNEQGCLTHLEETKDSLISWDVGHLTESGSRFLFQTLLQNQLIH